MALKGLDARSVAARKGEVNEEQLKAFIGGAPLQAQPETGSTKGAKPSGPSFKRTNFSLSSEVNQQIDQLSLVPRTFKVSRSDVVRAGVAALRAMSEKELVELLAKVTGAEEES